MNGIIGGITAAVVASVLGEVLLSDGEMKKYVRSGITCIVILILLITFLGALSTDLPEFDWSENGSYSELSETEKIITISKIDLINKGLYEKNIGITLDEYEFNENNLIYIHISTISESISDGSGDILDIEEIKEMIAKFLSVSTEIIVVD